jgi:hypothetical protein
MLPAKRYDWHTTRVRLRFGRSTPTDRGPRLGITRAEGQPVAAGGRRMAVRLADPRPGRLGVRQPWAPWRTCPRSAPTGFSARNRTSIERMRKRGGEPGPGISAFAPSYDPLDGNHATTRSTCRTPRRQATGTIDMARRMGDGLVHLHPVRRQRLDRRTPGARPRYPSPLWSLRNAGRRRLFLPWDP